MWSCAGGCAVWHSCRNDVLFVRTSGGMPGFPDQNERSESAEFELAEKRRIMNTEREFPGVA